MSLGGKKFGPLMMHNPTLCPSLPQHSQMILFLTLRAAITGWRDTYSVLVLVKSE